MHTLSKQSEKEEESTVESVKSCLGGLESVGKALTWGSNATHNLDELADFGTEMRVVLLGDDFRDASERALRRVDAERVVCHLQTSLSTAGRRLSEVQGRTQ